MLAAAAHPCQMPDSGNSTVPPAPGGLLPSGPLIVGYYQSWSALWKSNGADLDLANIPSYVNGEHAGASLVSASRRQEV